MRSSTTSPSSPAARDSNGFAVAQQRRDPAIGAQALVALEQRARVDVRPGAQVHAELARLLGAASLLLHRCLEACLIDRQPALARDVGGEVHRKAVGVVELEDRVAVDHLGPAQRADGALEQRHAVGERLGEALLFLLQHPLRVRAAALQLRIRLAHLRLQHRDQLVEERLLDAELVAVADGAADDPAQHVAAAFVGGQHAVDDEERAGADVIGDHAQRARAEIVVPASLPAAAIRFLNRSMS